ncbi:MAG TPA: GNAT family N-acetyltransferase [Acetobacteraceae bacterium]|nr:GNAT family N-acetyltransferase [Acetobacteraceae bacterium]
MRDKPAGRFSPACLFRPESVVVVGGDTVIGRQARANLGSGTFQGEILTVETPDQIKALPAAADLALFATQPTLDVLRALASKGTLAAAVLCPADALTELSRQSGVRMLGPDSFGIAVPGIGLNASRAHLPLPAGRVALVSQSSALCRTILDWAQPNGIGFSHIVGIGGRADIGFGIVLDWLSRDPGTGAILLEIKELRSRRAFLSAARAAAKLRPVVAIRPGTLHADPSGVTDRAFEAALRRAGVLFVDHLEDLLAAAETLARARPTRSEALCIVTNAVSAGQLAADAVLRDGMQLAGDIVRVAPEASQQLAAHALAASDCGGVLVVHVPAGDTDDTAIAALAACRDKMKLPLLVCAMGETTGAAHRQTLAKAGLAVFAAPEQAVRGFRHLVQDRRNRAAARELPGSDVLSAAADRDTVRGVFASVRRAGRLGTMQDEALAVLNAYGIPSVPNRVVTSADDAADAASLLGFPAVVKLRQSVRPNARASGGLALDLHDAHEIVEAARRLIGSNADHLLVQRQAVRWRELRIQVADDATFGPIINFGQGGTTADIVGDIAADLPPLNLPLAHALIGRTRAAATLGRFRDNPPANETAVAEALVRVSQLIVDFPEIAELDLNPLIVDTDGVVAADAWICLRDSGDRGGGLAISPYPAELVERWVASDGERLVVRPIRPEDAEQHGAFFGRLSPQDIRFRFFTAMRELSPEQTARLTQIDYDREMAFLAIREATGETVGVARLVCESERDGEFAIIVQQDMKGRGVASHLMHRLIAWARVRGLSNVIGQVLADNAPMLAFVRHLGFSVRRMPEEPDVMEARLALE